MEINTKHKQGKTVVHLLLEGKRVYQGKVFCQRRKEIIDRYRQPGCIVRFLYKASLKKA